MATPRKLYQIKISKSCLLILMVMALVKLNNALELSTRLSVRRTRSATTTARIAETGYSEVLKALDELATQQEEFVGEMHNLRKQLLNSEVTVETHSGRINHVPDLRLPLFAEGSENPIVDVDGKPLEKGWFSLLVSEELKVEKERILALKALENSNLNEVQEYLENTIQTQEHSDLMFSYITQRWGPDPVIVVRGKPVHWLLLNDHNQLEQQRISALQALKDGKLEKVKAYLECGRESDQHSRLLLFLLSEAFKSSSVKMTGLSYPRSWFSSILEDEKYAVLERTESIKALSRFNLTVARSSYQRAREAQVETQKMQRKILKMGLIPRNFSEDFRYRKLHRKWKEARKELEPLPSLDDLERELAELNENRLKMVKEWDLVADVELPEHGRLQHSGSSEQIISKSLLNADRRVAKKLCTDVLLLETEAQKYFAEEKMVDTLRCLRSAQNRLRGANSRINTLLQVIKEHNEYLQKENGRRIKAKRVRQI